MLSLIAPRLTGIVGLRFMSVVGVGGIAVGMILLLAFLAFITFKDIWKLIGA